MKKLMSVISLVFLFSGCAKLETAYQVGEVVGKKVLPESTKVKIRPYNEALKDGYRVLKEGNGATSE